MSPARLRLYVTGSTPRSLRAVERLRALCERHLAGAYELDVVDIYQQPQLARAANLVATPTLVREDLDPVRTLVGDLDAETRVVRLLTWPGGGAPRAGEGQP